MEWVNALNSLIDGLAKDAGEAGAGAVAFAPSTRLPTAPKPPSPVEENGFVVAEKPVSSLAPLPAASEGQGRESVQCVKKSQAASADLGERKPISASVSALAPTASEFSAPELEGNRWYIRKAINKTDQPIVITPDAINQALAIEDSQRIAVRVEGKINAIIADKCRLLDMEIGDVVSNVELLACSRTRLFLNGHVPTLVLDECEAVQVYISSPTNKDVKILTSKCAEINILVQAGIFDDSLQGDEALEYKEMALPVQFVTSLDPKTGKLVTDTASHIGA